MSSASVHHSDRSSNTYVSAAAAASSTALGGALPSPLETWEQQRVRTATSSKASGATASSKETTATSSSTLGGARRILPWPGGQRKDPYESETARNVRLLLARHHHQQQQQQVMTQPSSSLDPPTGDDSSDQFASAIPGDSFPDTERQLLSSSMGRGDDDDDDDDDEDDRGEEEEELMLLRRLNQSQARMEQIKRMLVNQRGFIVQVLKQMAEGRAAAAASASSAAIGNQQQHQHMQQPQRHGDEVSQPIRDRNRQQQPAPIGSSQINHNQVGLSDLPATSRLCPMCEAEFPVDDVDMEAFEMHVIEHFCFEEPDTLKYVGSESEEDDDEEEQEG